MDEARIKQLTEEVLERLRASSPETMDLEDRVAALEAAVQELQGGGASASVHDVTVAPVVHVHTHPSLQVLIPSGAVDGRCCLEPDKPCVQSGQCRTLGH